MIRAVLVASAAALWAAQAGAETIVQAEYGAPTTRYDHAILGDAEEWGSLILTTDAGRALTLTLPETRVFEDTAPRLADVTGDGLLDAIVVETDVNLGSRLAVYGLDGLIAATEYIGQTHRWLAPVGAADLDGDGRVEIVYIDRPHLARTLRIVQVEGDRLVEIASAPGLTNHRIGDTVIAGGIRDCGTGPEMVTANADWTRLMATRLVEGRIEQADLGPISLGFEAALACR